MENYQLLKSEFSAEDGSFLIQTRSYRNWDRHLFFRLITAMHSVAMDLKDHDLIPKWIARGFWYCEHFIPHWSSSEHLPKNDDDPYYEIANRTLHDLSSLLFKGRSPYIDDTLEKNIENLKA